MRVLMVAHECGVPQWFWDADSTGETLLAHKAAQGVLRDLNADKALEALSRERETPECCYKIAEAYLILKATLELALFIEDEPEKQEPLKGKDAWTAFVSDVTANKENFFQEYAENLSYDALLSASNMDDELVIRLEPYISDKTLKSTVAKTVFGYFLEPIYELICLSASITEDCIRVSQIRNCNPRLASTQSFLSCTGELPHANVISYGRLQIACERVQWKTSTRTPHGIEQDDNNVFFTIASDQGESPAMLRRLTMVAKEATDMVLGSVYNLRHGTAQSVQAVLGCVIRALMHSMSDVNNPSMTTQGVQCIHEFKPYSNDRSTAWQTNQGQTTQTVLVDYVESALSAGDAPQADSVFSFGSGSSKKGSNVVHCLVFVNNKLACCYTKKGHTQLSATDVFLLSTFVEGVFRGADGKSYDPGVGAAWDPLAPAFSNVNVEQEEPQEKPDKNRTVGEAQVAAAEEFLSKWRIDRNNYAAKKGHVMAHLATLRRHGKLPEARRVKNEWDVLVCYGRSKKRRSAQQPAPSTAHDSEWSSTPDDTPPPSDLPAKVRTTLANSFARPLSPSLSDLKGQEGGCSKGSTGPVIAAYEACQQLGATRDPSWFDKIGAANAQQERDRRATAPAGTLGPSSWGNEEDFIDELNSDTESEDSSVKDQEAPHSFTPTLPNLKQLWLQQGPGSERRPHAVFVDSLGSSTATELDDELTPRSRARKAAQGKETELKFNSIRVCIIEELQKTSRGGWMPLDAGECLPRMKEIRQDIRSKLTPLVDFITTLEKTHFNLVGGPYMEQCQGLMHFILVDRISHNRVISPRILPMRPFEGNECNDGFMHLTAEQQQATEVGLFPKVTKMLNGAQILVAKGYTESLWGDSAVQYYHKIWVETDDEELPIDPALLSVIQNRPWAIRDHLEGYMARDVNKKTVRCYELYAMYLGLIPPEAVERNNKNLLSLVLPSNNRSFD
eukprot:TRINITY_DN7865_c0_g1_i1.p1 TRINITY_DN7865_c0_g1~~TRINITY_DN7865_c0_g1_i1.p1  ORF type:complete len:966 (+),score=181.64 TRINITY_DN7865_c0_g1_i1:23-2899(+)